MSLHASEEEVERFLQQARNFKDNGKLDFVLGKEEKETLTQLGISYRDVYEQIDNLTVRNYFRGPTPDRRTQTDPEPVIWEFGLDAELEESIPEIYVKLKIRKDRDDLVFISYHFAQREIIYPFKH